MRGMTFERSLRMFGKPPPRKLNGGYPFGGGIERRCPKCGVPMANMVWEPSLNQIRLTCVGGCGFAWWAKPLDSK
jgi:ribosomal protein S27AE